MSDPLSWFDGFSLAWVLPFLFVIVVVVFFHELGHFLVARWCGVAVQSFSIGFGPEIVGFHDRKGTRWRISAIPLGGYVKFVGDENVASAGGDREAALAEMDEATRHRSFIGQPVRRRAAIAAAGPIANFILALVIFTLLFMLAGRMVSPPVVDDLVPDGAAIEAGLEIGDRIISIDGHAIESFSDIGRYVGFAAGRALPVVVDRGGERLTFTVTPQLFEDQDRLGNPYSIGRIGIIQENEEGELVVQRYGLTQALGMGLDQIWFTISSTVGYVGRVIAGRNRSISWAARSPSPAPPNRPRR